LLAKKFGLWNSIVQVVNVNRSMAEIPSHILTKQEATKATAHPKKEATSPNFDGLPTFQI
jgi:hypothetical protein